MMKRIYACRISAIPWWMPKRFLENYRPLFIIAITVMIASLSTIIILIVISSILSPSSSFSSLLSLSLLSSVHRCHHCHHFRHCHSLSVRHRFAIRGVPWLYREGECASLSRLVLAWLLDGLACSNSVVECSARWWWWWWWWIILVYVDMCGAGWYEMWDVRCDETYPSFLVFEGFVLEVISPNKHCLMMAPPEVAVCLQLAWLRRDATQRGQVWPSSKLPCSVRHPGHIKVLIHDDRKFARTPKFANELIFEIKWGCYEYDVVNVMWW